MLGKFKQSSGPAHPNRQALAYGAILAAVILLVFYPGVTLLRELVGYRGLALSPIAFYPLLWVVASVCMRVEEWVQAQAWWPRAADLWYWSVIALGVGIPLLAAFLMPMTVWKNASGGTPTLVAVAPLVVVAVAAAAWYRPEGQTEEGHG